MYAGTLEFFADFPVGATIEKRAVHQAEQDFIDKTLLHSISCYVNRLIVL